jgi:hypothetical protein
LCAEVNGLSVYERHAGLQIRQLLAATCGMRYRYFLGVKWLTGHAVKIQFAGCR